MIQAGHSVFSKRLSVSFQIRAPTETDLQSILDLYAEIEDDGQVLPIEKARSIFERSAELSRLQGLRRSVRRIDCWDICAAHH